MLRIKRLAVVLAIIAVFVGADRIAAIGFEDIGGPITVDSYTSLDRIPQGGEAHIAIAITINDPWHINAHEVTDDFLVPTVVTFKPADGITIKEIVYPEPLKKKLDISDKKMNLYELTVYIGALIEVSKDVAIGETVITADVEYQACDNEKCLMPETQQLFIKLNISDPHDAVDLTHAEIFEGINFGASTSGSSSDPVAAAVASRGWLFAFLLVFLGGLALNLTPCVYPMIPITVSYFGGQSGGRTSRTAILAVLYLLGMATMYSAMGLIASLTGSLFGSALQNPIVLGFVAVIMVGLSLSMFGMYEIRVPARLAGIAGTAKQGYAGSFLMGITVGIVAAPCIGPFVLGLLTFVGEIGNPALGFAMFFTLALGMGTPLVFLAIASGRISTLPKSGEWMEWIRKMFGVILLGMAVYFLRPLLGDTLYYSLLGGLLVLGGIMLGFILKVASGSLFFNAFRRTVGVAAPIYGLYLLLTPGNVFGGGEHGIVWNEYDAAVIAAASAEHRPVVIDFSAAWCLPCKELDHKTFAAPEVVEASKSFLPIKADLTRSSESVKKLREQYDIRGVPTIVFIDADGNEREDLRAVQFIPKEEFLARLAKLNE